MKTTAIIIVTLFFALKPAYGQFCSDFISYKQKVHNVVGFAPSNAQYINGWAIGWATTLEYCDYMDSVRINGIYTNISPFQPIVAAMAIMMTPFALFRKETYENYSKDTTQYDTSYDTLQINHKLNGIAVGLFELSEEFTVQGLQVTALYHTMDKLNGMSLTLFASEYRHFNGLMVSGVYNSAYKGKGVQIGLINSTRKMQGVQVGLWNKIGNFGFPIINFRFRKYE
jgi:hypothetical protein